MILFYGHNPGTPYACFSNWFPAAFDIDGYHYWCSEQYMMHQKALLFGDQTIAEEIMRSNDQKEIKALGRKVTPFDAETWNAQSTQIMFEGLLAKFSQNPEMKEELLSTDNAIIAEAAPRDLIWGIGLGKNNPKAQDPVNWRGKNKLGYVLMDVREALRNN